MGSAAAPVVYSEQKAQEKALLCKEGQVCRENDMVASLMLRLGNVLLPRRRRAGVHCVVSCASGEPQIQQYV